MIIKTMEAFGKAVDDAVELQIRLDGGWTSVNHYAYELSELTDLIGKGDVRTKPQITYYRVFEIEGELFIDSDNSPFPKWESINRDHIHDFQIESED